MRYQGNHTYNGEEQQSQPLGPRLFSRPGPRNTVNQGKPHSCQLSTARAVHDQPVQVNSQTRWLVSKYQELVTTTRTLRHIYGFLPGLLRTRTVVHLTRRASSASHYTASDHSGRHHTIPSRCGDTSLCFRLISDYLIENFRGAQLDSGGNGVRDAFRLKAE